MLCDICRRGARRQILNEYYSALDVCLIISVVYVCLFYKMVKKYCLKCLVYHMMYILMLCLTIRAVISTICNVHNSS